MKAYKPKTTNSSLSIRYALMSLCLTSVCYAVIRDHISEAVSYDRMSMLIILFNVISVGAMSLISVFADKIESKHTGVQLSVMLTIIGYFLPIEFGIDLKVVLLGLGSAVFYSFASSSILSRSRGKSRSIGLLLGGQSLGIACASYAGFAGHFFAPLLMIFAVPSDKHTNESELTDSPKTEQSVSPITALPLIAISYLLLSYELSSMHFPWDSSFKTQFELWAFIGLGHAVGGFICDKLGRTVTVAASACGGTMLILFCSDSKRLSLLGLLLFSAAFAPIATSAFRFLPKNPAFSFALMSAAAYLGQTMSFFVPFKGILMLFIAAAVITFTAVTELPFLKSASNETEDDNEDI